MEKEERQPEDAGIADTKMWLLKYCFSKPALLLTEEQVRVYCQMMAAVNQTAHYIKPF